MVSLAFVVAVGLCSSAWCCLYFGSGSLLRLEAGPSRDRGNVMGGQGRGLQVGFCGETESREGAVHLAGESFTCSLIQCILIEHKNPHLHFNVSAFCLASRKKNN